MATPISVNSDQLSTLSVQGLQVPKEGSKAIPVIFDFTATNQYTLNLQNIQQRNFFTLLQAMWIDNSLNTAELSISFPNTQQTITIPPGAEGYVNVICMNPAQITFTSSGNVYGVEVHLLNYPVTNAVWFANGETPVIIPGTVDVDITASITLQVQEVGNGTLFPGQQTVTTSDAALATQACRAVTIKAAKANTVAVYIGTTGVTDSTGYELDPGDILTLPVTNVNLVHVISGSSGQVVSWVATN
jgi:hypothetical protein